MMSTLRVAQRVAVARHQLRPRLAPADVERADNDVEARQELVVVVELAVGPDLQLAAVQQPEVGALLGEATRSGRR